MARTAFPVLSVVPQESLNITAALNASDPVNGNMFLNNGSTIMEVVNGSAVPCIVVITAVADPAKRLGYQPYIAGTPPPVLPAGIPQAQVLYTGYRAQIAAGGSAIFGPFRQSWWNQTVTDIGYVYVNFYKTDYTAASATVGALVLNVGTY